MTAVLYLNKPFSAFLNFIEKGRKSRSFDLKRNAPVKTVEQENFEHKEEAVFIVNFEEKKISYFVRGELKAWYVAELLEIRTWDSQNSDYRRGNYFFRGLERHLKN